MAEKVLKMALIGVGNMGKKYAEMITSGQVSGMKLSAIVIRRPELMEWGETLTNIDGEKVKIFRSSDKLFEAEKELSGNHLLKAGEPLRADEYLKSENSLFDAVIIATPHKTHKELAVKAFSLNKAVLCDKPVAADIGEAVAMEKAAKESSCIYGVVFHQRLYPKYIKIKELIDSGEIGDLKRISLINSRYLRTAHYHQSAEWRSSFSGEGGGALINQGQHILDMYQYLFGMPQRLYVAIPFGKYNDFDVDDEATLVMEYDNGVTGTFILSTGEACHEERLEVIGTKARILLIDDKLTITYHNDVNAYIKNEDVNSREHMSYSEETIQFKKAEEPYTQLLERFANAVLENDESYLVAKGSEGINSLMLCAGAYYSACNKAVVELPLGADEYSELMNQLIKKEEGRG